MFRAAWALQQQQQPQRAGGTAGPFLQLPLPLLDALFRGVHALQPAAAPQRGLRPTADDTGSSTTEATASACNHVGLMPVTDMVCLWQPFSAAELAAGVGQMQVAALISLCGCDGGGNSSDSNIKASELSSAGCAGSLGTPVTGTVLQRLDLTQTNPTRKPTEPAQQSAEGAASWSITDCPAEALQGLHNCACRAVRRELSDALESAGKLPVSLCVLDSAACCWPRCV